MASGEQPQVVRRGAPGDITGVRIADRFVVERRIGSGPVSVAYVARDELLKRRVTLKVFNPAHPDDSVVVQAQLQLATAVARMTHPNIITVIDVGEHEGFPFVVFEHVRGDNLDERIERHAPLRIAEILRVGEQVARALAHAHAGKVVHGNLRPVNVLLGEESEVKVVDFGGGSVLAELTAPDDPFRAPERQTGEARTDPTDDIYAIGILLLLALLGEMPSRVPDALELQMHRPDCDERLAALVTSCAAPLPEHRPSAMREVAAELSTILREREQQMRRRVDVGAQGEQGSGAGDGGGNAQRPEQTTASMDTALGDVAIRRDRRARMFAWSLVLVPVMALIVVGLMLAGEQEPQTAEKKGGKAGDNSPVKRVEVLGVKSFDPFGDGEEREDIVAGAIDDDPETSWQTEGYVDVDYGTKSGVGLFISLNEPKELRELRVVTDLSGWHAEVRAADQPGAKIEDWKVVKKSGPVLNGTPLRFSTGGKAYRVYLLWVTRLAIDVKEPSRARARVIEIRAFE